MNRKGYWYIGFFLFVVSALLITAFSACSPLYPLNPWDDANCFLMLGRSLLEGRLPYRDIFDQKGPGVYLIQAMGDAVGVRPFFGFYLIEIAALWEYLWFAFLTMMLFVNRQGKEQPILAILLTCLLGFAYTTSDFFYYGNTVEELGLPWIMLTFYALLRYAKQHILPSHTMAIVMGVGIGIIFWSKFTVLSPFVGALIAMLIICIRNKQMTDFWRTVGNALIGFIGVTIIVLAIFIHIGGLADMFDGYFGYNLFRYHAVGAEDGGDDMRIYPLRLVAWVVLSAIPLIPRPINKDVRLIVTCSFATTLILFAITTVYIYYFILCFAFFPLLFYYIRRCPVRTMTYVITVVLAVWMTITDFSLMQRCRGTFPQAILPIAKQLSQQDCDRGVLTYRSRETGLYTYANMLPPNRFFFLLSVVHQDLKDDQDACLQSHRCRYVIVKDQVLEPEAYQPIEENGYHLIMERHELFRTLRLLNPVLYSWNLGWTQPIMRLFLDEEPIPQEAVFRVYERHQ